MVKSVVAEETQLKLVEHRLPSNSQTVIPHHHERVEVGLVIGKLSTALDRGFIFDLIPTPNNEAAQPPCSLLPAVNNPTKQQQRSSSSSSSKGGGLKSSNIPSSLLIDTDWVSEHARQVSRLLLGGINVIGLYVYVNDTVFKNSTILLSQTLKTLAQTSSSTNDETLLIHISYAPIRWTCRTCVTSSSTLRPCDFKMGRLLKSLQTYKCIYNFHITFPIYLASASKHKTFSQILRDAISSHLKELKGAVVLIDGKPVMEDETCNSDDLHEVEFLLPFMKDAFAVDLGSQKDMAGVIVFRGSICSFTFMNPKEPISQVLTDIRDDISSSLLSRLDIICDEAEGEGELYSTPDADNNPSSDIATEKPTPQLDLQLLSKHCNISFPRRVFIPWLPGTFICDYLQQAETVEVLKDHFVELMSMEAPTDISTILELEREAPTVTTSRSFWEVSNICSDAHSPDVIKKSDNRTIIKDSMQNPIKSINLVGAIIFLLLSIIVGVALLLVKRA